jgi:hypothetical protein
VSAWVQVWSAKAPASAGEIRLTVQVLVRVSVGERAALWRAASSAVVSVVSGALLSASAEGRAALWQVAWCHWSEADLYREGLASPERVGLVFLWAALRAGLMNLAVSGSAWLLDGWVCRV